MTDSPKKYGCGPPILALFLLLGIGSFMEKVSPLVWVFGFFFILLIMIIRALRE